MEPLRTNDDTSEPTIGRYRPEPMRPRPERAEGANRQRPLPRLAEGEVGRVSFFALTDDGRLVSDREL